MKKTNLVIGIITIVLLASSTSMYGYECFLIDFGSSSTSPGGNWNTISTDDRNSTVGSLKDFNTGLSTAASYLGANWADCATNQWGATSPAWINANAANDDFYSGSPPATITISGLVDLNYSIEFVSSSIDGHVEDITIGGVFANRTGTGPGTSDNWNVATAKANANWMIWDNVTPTTGSITITITRVSGSWIYANALKAEGDVPLPVTLTSFGANYSKNNVVLNWTTQSETDNLGFNLYRSENENGFENEVYIQINSVLIDGMGTTTVPTNYSFADEYPNVEGHTYYYWLQSVSTSNELELYGPVSIEIPAAGQLPTMTILSTNYPNPFNPETTIAFSIKENETGILSIYNLKGQGILKESFEAGNHQYHWNAEGLASGIYLYKLSSPTTNITRKMVMLK